MRFRFCGDLDCPDWVLAEISVLAKLTSVKIKLLCIQVIKDIVGENIDYDKVTKLTADAKFDISDIKASVSALNFMLSSAAKYSVDGDSLANELQQLGLPKEHSTALCKSYSDNQSRIQEELRRKSLRLSHLVSVNWRVDFIVSSSEMKDVNQACVHLQLAIKNPDTNVVEPVSFTMTSQKFRVFLSELKQAHTVVESLT